MSDVPAVATGVDVSIMVALTVLMMAALFAFLKQRLDNRAARDALNSLAGLGMFDSAARLVLCNRRYIEMSQLPSQIFQKGTPLHEIFIQRAQRGTFAGDPDHTLLILSKRRQTDSPRKKLLSLRMVVPYRWYFAHKPVVGGCQHIPTLHSSARRTRNAIRCVKAKIGAQLSRRRLARFVLELRLCS